MNNFLVPCFQAFKQNYEFIGEIKKKELATLKRQFKEEDDPESKEKIKFLITRMVRTFDQHIPSSIRYFFNDLKFLL